MTNPIADPFVENVDTDAESPLVHIEATVEGVATITLNSPATKNAFDDQVIAALRQAFETMHGAEGVRVVFVQGAGSTFSLTLPRAELLPVISPPEDRRTPREASQVV